MHGVFKSLRNASREGAYSPEDVYRSALYAVLVLESNVAVLYLQGHRNQHRIASHSHEVSPHIEGHQVHINLVAYHFFQVFELYCRWPVQLRILFQTVEFLRLHVMVERAGAQSLNPALGKAAGLIGYAHLFIEGQPGIWGI